MTGGRSLVGAWNVFLDAFERRDDGACLAALQRWIAEWDACFERGDFSGFDEIYAPDFRAENHMGLLGLASFTGVDGFRRMREDTADVIAGRFVFEIREFERAGDSFCGLGVFRAKGRYSGILMRHKLGIAWTVRDRHITSALAFLDHDRPRRAAGISAAPA